MKYSEFRNGIDIFIANNGDFNASDEIVTLWDKESSDYLKSLETHNKPIFPVVEDFIIACPYGYSQQYFKGTEFHWGLDIYTYTVRASFDGFISGIRHFSNGDCTVYLEGYHDSAAPGLKMMQKNGHVKAKVSVGQHVKKGDLIAVVMSKYNHLHVEYWQLLNKRQYGETIKDGYYDKVGRGREKHVVWDPITKIYYDKLVQWIVKDGRTNWKDSNGNVCLRWSDYAENVNKLKTP